MAISTNTYEYSINITLVNKGDPFIPDFPGTPYYYLLNQNIFPNTTYQNVILKEVLLDGVPAQFVLSEDMDGNPWIKILTNRSLGKDENASLYMNFLVEVNNRSFDLSGIGKISEIPKELSDKYSLVGVWDPSNIQIDEILSVVNSIKANEENVLSIVLKILEWFEENISYNPGLKAPQDVWTTFSTKSGDCDDQANLFVLFCRILGIPAYTSLGSIYLSGTQLMEEDNNMLFNLTNVVWHGWVMVYLPTKNGGGWYPVDLTFFKDAYSWNRHIKSNSLLDHINGSAFSQLVTLEYSSINYINYVKESVDSRNIIINSDTLWIESHFMNPIISDTTPIISEVQPSQFFSEGLYLFLIVVALVLILWIFHKPRSGGSRITSSSS
ncbi:MAG: transglutaminase-like domain-containing protein [Candidatus Methanomethylicaceae archaeon]